jgi:hypothetical protein
MIVPQCLLLKVTEHNFIFLLTKDYLSVVLYNPATLTRLSLSGGGWWMEKDL